MGIYLTFVRGQRKLRLSGKSEHNFSLTTATHLRTDLFFKYSNQNRHVVDGAWIENTVIVLGGEGTEPDFSLNFLVLENPTYFS